MNLLYALLGALLFLAGASYIFFFRGEVSITNYPSTGTDIIAFGDSLVEGVGATEGNDFVSLIAQEIGHPIINLGRSSDTTALGLERIGELEKYNPKVVIVLLGGNDYLRRVPEAQTFENLSKIISYIHGRGAVVLLLGIRGGLFRDHFDEEFEKLRDTHHTAFVSNVLEGLLGDSKYMSDEIHPNNAGYAQIAERVLPVLKELLE